MLGMLLHYVVVILFSRYFAAILFAFIFMKLTWQIKNHLRTRYVNMLSYSVLYMFVKKEENGRLTIYKIDSVHDNVPDIVPNGLLKLF